MKRLILFEAARALVLSSCAFALVSCSDSKTDPDPTGPDGLVVTVDREITLAENARIPQDDPNFDRAEVSADSIVLHYTKAPTIVLEVGHVIAGTGGVNTFLRRITAITESTDTLVAVDTESAFITDLIADGAFTIDFTPDATQWQVHGPPDIGGRTLPLESELSIFSFGPGGGFSCAPVVGAEPIEIKPILKPDFSHRVELDITPSFLPPFGELQTALFSVKGSVQVGLEIDTSLSGGVQCALDLIEYIRDLDGNPNSMKFVRYVTFAIGPVPMQLTIFLEPVFKVEGTISAKISSIQLSALATMTMEVGVKYDLANEWEGIFDSSATGTMTGGIADDAETTILLSGKASAGFTVGGLLYDTAGPFVSVTGFLEDQMEANLDTCTLTSQASFGAEVTIGLKAQIPVIAEEIFKVSEAFELFEVVIADLTDPLPFCSLDAGVADAATADAPTIDASTADAATVDGGILGGLFWAEYSTGSVRTVNGAGAPVSIVTGLTTPIGLAVDVSGGKIYWNDQGPEKIQRANLDGSGVEDVVTGAGFVRGMGIDTVAGKIYWTDDSGNTVSRSNLDGTSVEVVVTFGDVDLRMVAVDSVNGKIYMTMNDATLGGIYRANLDGSSLLRVVVATGTANSGIAVDPAGGKIYWTDYLADAIYSANLDGSGGATVASSAGAAPWSLGVDTAGGVIYFSDGDKLRIVSTGGTGLADYLTGLGAIRSVAYGN